MVAQIIAFLILVLAWLSNLVLTIDCLELFGDEICCFLKYVLYFFYLDVSKYQPMKEKSSPYWANFTLMMWTVWASCLYIR